MRGETKGAARLSNAKWDTWRCRGCYWMVLRSAAWCCMVLRGAVWCCVVLCGAMQCYVVLCGTVWCCVMLCIIIYDMDVGGVVEGLVEVPQKTTKRCQMMRPRGLLPSFLLPVLLALHISS